MVGGEVVAPGVRRVRLRVLDAERVGHRAGQYILLHARAADGSIVKRAYSIASPPRDDPSFEVCVRRIPERPASGFVHAVAPGTEVSFTGPWGKFVVEDATRDLVLVATGTGISCTGAILEDELERPRSRRVRLLWGLRHESDVHGLPRFRELMRIHSRFSYAITLSRPGPGWRGARGRVTAALRAEAQPDGLYYLAGNGAMIADAEDALASAGVPATSIRKEIFFTPGQVRVPLRERQARTANRERPGRAIVGIALHAGASALEVVKAIEEALALTGLQSTDVRNIAAAAKASDESGLVEAAATLGLPVEYYLPSELEAAAASASACETLARVSAASTLLILPKHKTPAVTVAVAAVDGGETP
ncbi:MAG: cobalamin biosynthesis protein [Candidatus Rokubacteria bacterium]|nr:cobalamin biosynthesis protein [Candidatus Rokubacteria bacterium]